MRHIIFLAAMLACILWVPAASASDYPDMDMCMGKAVIARGLCKDPSEVNFVTRIRANLYLFSVFYANKPTHFFVNVSKDMIRIQGKEFQTVTRTIPYHFDETAKCGIIDYSVPDCPTSERIVCCSEKTVEEKLDEKFWDRPIPELLEEDLQKALEGAMVPEDVPENGPAQEAGQPADAKPKPKTGQ